MIALYLRKSRADEELEEETLTRHRAILTEFAAKNELTITKTYEEIVSGENIASRPQMLQLLQDVEDNKYEAVLCMDIDRLGRGSMQEQGIILETFKRTGTRIITPRKTYDLSDEFDEEYSEFEAFMARKELKIIKRRLRRGIERSIDEGCYIPSPPFGYIKIKVGGKPSIAPHPEHADIIRIIFDMYVNRLKSPNTIAKMLNTLSLKTMRGKHWIPATVRSILKNPTYVGKIIWKKHTRSKTGKRIQTPENTWIIRDGLHQPIIPSELFLEAQEILQNRYTPPSFDGTIKNPLAGILYCKVCGHVMSRRPYKDKPARCVCRCVKSSRIDTIEEILIDSLKNLNYSEFSQVPASSHKYNIKNALQNLNLQKKNLHNLLEQGIYDVSTFQERACYIESRIAEISALNKQAAPAAIPPITSALQIYPLLEDSAEKNRLLKSVIEKAVYYRDKDNFELTIYPRF